MITILSIFFIIAFATYIIPGVLNWKYEALAKGLTTFIYSVLAFISFLFTDNAHLAFIATPLVVASFADWFLAEQKHVTEDRAKFYFMVGLGLFFTSYLTIAIVNIIFLGFTMLSWLLLGVMLMIGISLWFTLDKTKMTGLEIPVIAYIIMATLLASSGISNAYNLALTLGPTILFISDALIAINLFKKPIPQPEVLVLSTYNFGIYLTLLGILLI